MGIKVKEQNEFKLMNELTDAQRVSKFRITILGIKSKRILSFSSKFTFKLYFYTFSPRDYSGTLAKCTDLDEAILILD